MVDLLAAEVMVVLVVELAMVVVVAPTRLVLSRTAAAASAGLS